MPADVQTAQWMVANGIAADLDEAYTRVQESRSDPTRFVASYVDQELKAQESAGVYPGDDNYLTTEQMRTKAISVLQTIRQSTRGTSTGGDGSGEPKGLKITGADSQALPDDGSAVPQEDGSYSGRVDRSGNAQSVTNQAPPQALDMLNKNPDLAAQFKEKYGYLPEGF
jgi:hypothetical protein